MFISVCPKNDEILPRDILHGFFMEIATMKTRSHCCKLILKPGVKQKKLCGFLHYVLVCDTFLFGGLSLVCGFEDNGK